MALGSSPRVRGTQENAETDNPRRRFIPACAGNTSAPHWHQSTPSVHPRVCGEHSDVVCVFHTCCGSSPRVRGTRQPVLVARGRLRFIPACAGNTLPPSTLPTRPPVHPRVCGEHPRGAGPAVRVGGSSPRVRGTPLAVRDAAKRARFIPACAGNTAGAVMCGPSPPVHPRVCGEHHPPRPHRVQACGSSPRVRGTPASAGQHLSKRRFIPACAGNTSPRRFPRH